MKGYRLQIKNKITVIITGKDYAWYEEFRKTNEFGNDIIDQIVYEKLLSLPDRHFLPVALAYYCHEIEDIQPRMIEQNTQIKDETILKYLSDSRKRTIELIIEDNKAIIKLKETIREEYENSYDKN